MEGKSTDWLRGPSGPTVCRCCFAEGCYKDISTEYFWMGKREVYSEMLTETFDLSIAFAQTSGPNSNSRLICEPCISRLRDASEFKRQVQECEKMFMQYLDPGRTVVDELQMEITQEPSEKVKLEPVKLEKNHSDDDFDDRGGFEDMDEDDLDDQPLTKLASKVPKKESVDLLDLLDNAKAEKRKSSAKTKSSPAKKAKTKKETPKATASKAKPEKKKKDYLGWSRDAAKQNAQMILKHSTAYPFLQLASLLRCCFCRETFADPAQFRAHMDIVHQNVDRSTCHKGNLDTQTRVDITNLRCKKCIKAFASIEALATHLHDEHELDIELSQSLALVPLRLEKNRYECVVCSQKFTGTMQLSRHTGMHYFRNICDICGKRFESRRGIDNHVKVRHNIDDILRTYYCRSCKKSYPTLEAKKEHMRTNKSCLPFRCAICNERFLFWERREDHQVEVHGKERKIFRCTECDKVFERRTLLYFHFKAAHTEDHKCQYCELTFSTRRDLREHTHQHTGERPLKCHVCNKTFARDKALRQHLIIHDDSKKKMCPVCSRLFTDNKKLKMHVQKHHPEIFSHELGQKRQ
ncbi:zinc finger protein 320-like isoform X19 [Cydia fagiglandana]|uniref:zinc finger protein 320-like isoform X19 n=1 Tax=Cydia fagiglandana TaxID=1458189 RepID=UPI002FEE23DE